MNKNNYPAPQSCQDALQKTMANWEIKSLEIPEIKVISKKRITDSRGYFVELFKKTDFESYGKLPGFEENNFVQLNQSFSKKNTLRGLHFQWEPPLGKMVRVIQGKCIDLILDIRKESPHFGQLITYELKSDAYSEKEEWIWIPPGFAHGNFYLEDTHLEYLYSSEYNRQGESGISIFSPGIIWSKGSLNKRNLIEDLTSSGKIIISERDQEEGSLEDWIKKEEFNLITYKPFEKKY